jgi:hypothetical protein
LNQKKAKALRKLLFKDKDYRLRSYGRKPTGPIINIGDLESVSKDHKLSLRRIYQRCKQVIKHSKIQDIKRTLFNEVPLTT